MPLNLNVFHQPKPFYMIFSLEFWERFGYAGVSAILALYFVKHLGFHEAEADIVFGSFFALTFGLIAIGGKLGDAYLGTKRLIILGAATLVVGYFILGMSYYYPFLLFHGLGAIAVGVGLFKANPSSLLSHCYKEGDSRIDGAFTMYYMAINLGALTAMFSVPYLASKYNWSIGFYICSFGLVLCLFSFILMRKSVKNIGSKADRQPFNFFRLMVCIIGTIITIFLSAWLLQHILFAQIILYIIGAVVFFIYIRETIKLKGKERTKMWISLCLLCQGFVFFILSAQMPTSLTFFAKNNVHHDLLGIPITPAVFQALNPLWVVVGSPFVAGLYSFLAKRGYSFTLPFKFAVGMMLCASGFLILPLAVKTADEFGIISSHWMIIVYGLQSMGELFISALGLSMIAQFVPKHLGGFLMGAWFLNTAFASIAAGYVASLTAAPVGITDPIKTLPIYSNMFMAIGICTVVVAVIMLLTAPYVNRLITRSS